MGKLPEENRWQEGGGCGRRGLLSSSIRLREFCKGVSEEECKGVCRNYGEHVCGVRWDEHVVE